MAIGSMRRILMCEETTEGVIPASPAWQELRNTGGTGITITRNTIESGEIRADRQSRIPGLGNKGVSFSLPFELSFGTFDALLASLLGGAWTSDVLTNGTTRKTFAIEEGFTDIGEYHLVRGCIVNSMTLKIANGAIVSGTFELLGLADDGFSTATAATEYTAATDTEAITALIGSISEAGTAFAAAQSLDLTITNNGKHVYALFNDDPYRNALGRLKVTGSLVTFFEDVAVAKKFLNKTPSSIAFTLQDAASNAYTASIPHLVYTGESRSVSEDDIPMTLPFQAGVDSATKKTISVARSAA